MANVFAIESFMDQLAHAVGQDPVAFRLRHLADERARAASANAVFAATGQRWRTPPLWGIAKNSSPSYF